MGALFSIIMPCFNIVGKPCYILKLLEQTSYNFELMLVNDNSSDETSRYLENFSKVLAERGIDVTIISNERNLGAGESRNVAIKASCGEYLLFLDSDDYLDPNCVANVSKTIAQFNKPDVVLFDYLIDYNGHFKRVVSFKEEGYISIEEAFLNAPNGVCGKVVKRDLVVTNDIRFLSIKRNEDYPFFRNAFLNSKSIIYISKPFYNYVMNDSSLMHNKNYVSVDNAIESFNAVKALTDDIELLKMAFLKNCYYSNIISMLSLNYSRKKFYSRLSFLRNEYRVFYSTKNIKKESAKIRIVIRLANSHLFLLLRLSWKIYSHRRNF